VNTTIEMDDDFAAVMQELSAQAAGAPPREEEPRALGQTAPGFTDLLNAVQMLGQRIEGLENSVTKKFTALESARGGAAGEFALQFQKLDEQVAAIRNSETVSQKLFDSLHQELISYRDNFVRESLQKPFIRDLLVLFDDLSAIAGQFAKTVAGEESCSANARSRDNLSNTLHFLVEILHRLEVNEIETKKTVDRELHRVISYEPADCRAEDGRIVRQVKRGFMWRGRVLRPEEVIAKRFQ
jgi:molecular chaperone GrpE (heat shock protein)